MQKNASVCICIFMNAKLCIYDTDTVTVTDNDTVTDTDTVQTSCEKRENKYKAIKQIPRSCPWDLSLSVKFNFVADGKV